MALASVASDGTQGNSTSENVTVSSDGRYVAFESASTNLVAGDSNGARDVFVRDTQAPETFRASVDSGGAQGNGASTVPAIGNSGDDVAFVSAATNLVAGDTNGVIDAFAIDVDVPPPTTTTTTTTSPAPSTTTTTTPAPTTTTMGPVTLPTLPVTPTVPGSESGVGGGETAPERKSPPPLVQIELADDQRFGPGGAGEDGERTRTAPNGPESRWVRMSPELMVLLGGLGVAGLFGGFFAMGILAAGSGLFLFPFWRRRKRDDENEGSEASTPPA